MRKTILTVVGSALIVAASMQFADAAQRHHGKANQAVTSAAAGPQRQRLCGVAGPDPTVRLVALFGRLFGTCRTLNCSTGMEKPVARSGRLFNWYRPIHAGQPMRIR